MKTIVGTVLVYLLTVPQLATSQPDKEWWACQFIDSAGMDWEAGAWSITRFTLRKPFVLVDDGAGLLDLDSVSKPLDARQAAITCTNANVDKHIFCQSRWTGSSFSFDPKTGTGAVAEILGAFGKSDDSRRDSLLVSAFECIKG